MSERQLNFGIRTSKHPAKKGHKWIVDYQTNHKLGNLPSTGFLVEVDKLKELLAENPVYLHVSLAWSDMPLPTDPPADSPAESRYSLVISGVDKAGKHVFIPDPNGDPDPCDPSKKLGQILESVYPCPFCRFPDPNNPGQAIQVEEQILNAQGCIQ